MNSFIKVIFLVLSLAICFSCEPETPSIIDGRTIQQKCFTGNKSFKEELIEYGSICLDSLCSTGYEGRKVTTKGWEQAYQFLLSEIEEMGYNPITQPFKTENGTDITNIIVDITREIDSTVIVGAHFDGAVQSTSQHHFPAANDNGSGVITQLMLLKALSQEALNTPRSIKVCFWGCEEVFEGVAFRGSTYFTKSLNNEELALILLYINIDTVGHQCDENVVCLNHSGERRVEDSALKTSLHGRFNYDISKLVTNLFSDFYSFFKAGVPYLNYHDHCIDSNNQNVCSNKLHTSNDIPTTISLERLYNISCVIQYNIETY